MRNDLFIFFGFTLFLPGLAGICTSFTSRTQKTTGSTVGNPIPNVGYGDIFWKDRPLLLKKYRLCKKQRVLATKQKTTPFSLFIVSPSLQQPDRRPTTTNESLPPRCLHKKWWQLKTTVCWKSKESRSSTDKTFLLQLHFTTRYKLASHCKKTCLWWFWPGWRAVLVCSPW